MGQLYTTIRINVSEKFFPFIEVTFNCSLIKVKDDHLKLIAHWSRNLATVHGAARANYITRRQKKKNLQQTLQ